MGRLSRRRGSAATSTSSRTVARKASTSGFASILSTCLGSTKCCPVLEPKFKFSGRQKIFVSKKFGFTKWNRDEYQEMRASGHLKTDGVNVQYMPEHGPLSVWCKTQMELAGL